MYPKNTLEYTSGYRRIQKYVCILPRTPEYITDYRIQQDTSRIHASSPPRQNTPEYKQNTQSACIPSSSRFVNLAGTCSLALLPEGKVGLILLIHSSQAAPQERAAVLGVAASYYLPWPLASSKPSSAAA